MKWQDALKVIVGREVAGFLARVAYLVAGLLAGDGLPPVAL